MLAFFFWQEKQNEIESIKERYSHEAKSLQRRIEVREQDVNLFYSNCHLYPVKLLSSFQQFGGQGI